HHPAKKGDDKSKLPQIKSALGGQAAGGLSVSPTSGEATEESVYPIKIDGAVIGTMKVGSYFKEPTAVELKRKTGLDVVFVAGGKITEQTFAKGITVPLPADLGKGAEADAQASDVEVDGISYTQRFVHLPGIFGAGMTIGFFGDRTAIQASKRTFVTSLMWKGVVAFALILPIVLALAHFATRQLLRLAEAMKRIAAGGLDTEVPYASRTDEVGVMAKTVEVFKANAVERQRLETERAETATRAAAERREELARLANGFEAAIGE